MLWADNKSITLQIVFPEKACKKHISSHFHFFKGDVQALLFFFLLSCTVLLNGAGYGWSWKCKRTSFLNSWVLSGGLGAIWMSGEEALNELFFVLLQRLFELIVKFPWTEKPTFALIWYLRGAVPGALWWTYAPAAVTLCFDSLPPHRLPTSTGACHGGTSDPSSWFMVLDLGSFQVVWPSSETDINWEDQSGLAFEEVFQILLCNPAEKCDVPFMFPFHLSFERAKRGSSCDRGLLMLAADSFQINFYIFVTSISQPLYFLDLDIALARLPVSKNNFIILSNANDLVHHAGYVKCCSLFSPWNNIGSWVIQDCISYLVNVPVILPYAIINTFIDYPLYARHPWGFHFSISHFYNNAAR